MVVRGPSHAARRPAARARATGARGSARTWDRALCAWACALAACAAEAGVGVPLDGGADGGTEAGADGAPDDGTRADGETPDATRADGETPDGAPRDGAARDGAGPTDGGPGCAGPPYPVVLHHGFFGFEGIGPVDYFFRVASTLRARGDVVVEAQVDPINSTEARALDLAEIVDDTLARTGACKVDLIAHSQGGLDARRLVGGLGYGDRVAAIVTVSTPHRGTRVADALLRLAPGWSRDLLDFFARIVGRAISDASDDASLLAALGSLSEARAAAFARDNPDDPRVAFFSVAGRSDWHAGTTECRGAVWPNPRALDRLDPLLSAVETFVQESALLPVANDGLVTVPSARWGTFLGCVPADHFDEIGQIADVVPDPSSGWDHVAFYVSLVDFLRERGF